MYIAKVSPYWVKKCLAFAESRQLKDGAFYGKRGGLKFEDLLAGALGEVAAYNFLKSQDVGVGKPDFSLQPTKQKSFKADLGDGNAHYHVKSQTLVSEALYGRSWILQRKDPILHKTLVNHYLILTTVDLERFSVEIHCVIDINAVVDKKLIGECKLMWFRRDKVAIYFADLEKNLTKEERCVIL